MNLKKSVFIAVILFITFIGFWELYWRSKPEYYNACLEDDRYLWAEQREKVETASKNDVVIIGSSRTGFNFNTHVWEEVQGIKPINLSTDGKPPGPFFEDIVNNTTFNGTLIIGVTPVMWFLGKGEHSRWADANKWVEHYHNQTYAQKLGYWISKPLQRNLVMLTSSELKFYNDLDLKSLINRLFIKGRPDERYKLPNFSYHDEDRNLIMFSSVVSNPEFAKKIQDIWNQFLPNLPDYDAIENNMPSVFEDYLLLINKFKSRGGKIIFIRHKAEANWNIHIQGFLPRAKVWDVFIGMVDCPSYHFEDYEFMSKYTLPDWSHMNSEDAISYTKDMVNKMIDDGYLINMKTN